MPRDGHRLRPRVVAWALANLLNLYPAPAQGQPTDGGGLLTTGYVRVSVRVMDPPNFATLGRMLVFQTNAPGSESSGWSASFEPGRCGNGNLPPSDSQYFYGRYYAQHNCRHPHWHFESAENEVAAGTYTFKMSGTSGGDGWAVNGYDFYAQLNRADDVYTHVAGSHTDIAIELTVGNPSNQYSDSAISVAVTQTPIAPPQSAVGPPIYIPVAWSASWFAASAFCSARGGSLAAVTSADESQLLLQALTTAGFDRVWLGGNDRNLEGTWVWVGDGRSVRTRDSNLRPLPRTPPASLALSLQTAKGRAFESHARSFRRRPTPTSPTPIGARTSPTTMATRIA